MQRQRHSLSILLFTAVPRTLSGGVANVYARLERDLRCRGHDVTALWARPRLDASEPDGLAIPHGRGAGVGGALRYAHGTARFVPALAALLRRHRPDVVNVHFIHARMARVFLTLRPLFGYRLVLSAHGSDIFAPPDGNDRWLPRVLPGADAITVVTPPLGERIRNFPRVRPERVHLILNGIDEAFWSGAPEQPAETRAPIVVTVGQLRPVKGHDILLDAWPVILAAHPSARLIIIGDGPARHELERQAADLGVSRTVDFAGQLPPERVRDALGAARAFVLPSRSEAMPLALLEAMAAGVPAVATAVGGVPDILAGGAGIAIPPEDSGQLADAVVSLLAMPEHAERLAGAARRRARAYSADAMVHAYESLFLSLVAPHAQ